MTAYRYVRLGQLPSTQRNGRWIIRRADVDAPAPRASQRRGAGRGAGRRRRPALCASGWLGACWPATKPAPGSVVERALSTGYTPAELYLQLLAPALRTIGEGWQQGS